MSTFNAITLAAMRLLQPSETYNGAYSQDNKSNDDNLGGAGLGGSDTNSSTSSGNNNNNNGGGGGGNDAYEFIAFLLWYVFLVLCCVIPTCCAYRRRRQVEARMAQQQTNMDRWQATNMFIVASSTGSGFRPGSHQHEAQLQAHRTKYLEQELKATTMVRNYIVRALNSVVMDVFNTIFPLDTIFTDTLFSQL
jgi:hypothetical protein